MPSALQFINCKKTRRAGNEEAEEEEEALKQRHKICLYFMQYANRVLLSKLREMRKWETANLKRAASKSRHRFSLSLTLCLSLSVSVFLAPSPTYDLGKQPNAHSLKQFSKQTSHSSAASSRQLLTHIFIYKLLILYAQPHARGPLPGGGGGSVTRRRRRQWRVKCILCSIK